MKTKKGRNEAIWGYLMILPTVLGLINLNIDPFIKTIIMSFSYTKDFGAYDFSGFDNYITLFAIQEFWKAAVNP